MGNTNFIPDANLSSEEDAINWRFDVGDDDIPSPDKVWKKLKDDQVFEEPHYVVSPASSSPDSKSEVVSCSTSSSTSDPDDSLTTSAPYASTGRVRFVCISDTHGLHEKPVSSVLLDDLPPGDVLLHAGDFTNKGGCSDLEKFGAFLRAAASRYTEVLFIAGNHDVSLDSPYYDKNWSRYQKVKVDTKGFFESLPSNVKYLEDSGVTTVGGLTVFGSPWQPYFCGWAFNLARGGPCLSRWKLCPSDVDILMTHGPPLGRGDKLVPMGGRAGCIDLLREIQDRIKPKVHVFGHIHEGYGVSSDGVTDFINASTCTFRYRPTNPPIVFELPGKPTL